MTHDALTVTEALVANAGFYAAFRERDVEAMDALWARQHGVFCLHPGWSGLLTRESVMESWQGILGNPQTPEIFVYGEEVVNAGPVAFVICYEVLGGAVLVASNGFARESDEVVLVSHQSGQCADPPAPPAFQ